MMKNFFRKEPVLVIAAAAAVISCFFVLPDGRYAGYIDFKTLALLYCLMTVVAGLRDAGLFELLSRKLCMGAGNLRLLGLLLVLLCFFSSMLVTNDVALLTFVPFAIMVLAAVGQEKRMIFIIVLQTVAANLGSMLTPIGNPQNLYLYSHYGYSLTAFLRVIAPYWCLSLVLIAGLCVSFLPAVPVTFTTEEKYDASQGVGKPGIRSNTCGEAGGNMLKKDRLILYTILFAVCLLVVMRLLPWPVMLALTVAALAFFHRENLFKADFMLLLTFIAFFVFSGNLARISAVDRFLRTILEGRVYLTGVLASQAISNVPAALLLSGFTNQADALLLGVNIGGLGTPVASLASLISMKLYFRTPSARSGRYMLIFTVVNAAFLLVLSLVVYMAGGLGGI